MAGEEALFTVFSQLMKLEIVAALWPLCLRVNEIQTRETLFEVIRDQDSSYVRLAAAIGEKHRRIDEEHGIAVKWAHLDQEEEDRESENEFFTDVGDDVHKRCIQDFLEHCSEYYYELKM